MSLWSGQIRHLEGSALSRTESKVAFFFEYGSQSAPHFDRTLLPSIAIMVFHRHHWEDKGGTQPLLSLSKKTPNDHQTLHTVMHGVQGRMWAEGENGLWCGHTLKKPGGSSGSKQQHYGGRAWNRCHSVIISTKSQLLLEIKSTWTRHAGWRRSRWPAWERSSAWRTVECPRPSDEKYWKREDTQHCANVSKNHKQLMRPYNHFKLFNQKYCSESFLGPPRCGIGNE